jgi:hypothetical protein
MKGFLSFITIAIGAVVLSSCNISKDNRSDDSTKPVSLKDFIHDSVFLKSSFALRGIKLGEEKEAIIRLEKFKMVEQDPEFLLFSNSPDSFPLSVTIAYTLVNNSLEETEIRLETDEDSLSDLILPEVLQFLKNSNGNPESDQGISVFRLKNELNSFISVSDNSSEGHSSLSILYYKEK